MRAKDWPLITNADHLVSRVALRDLDSLRRKSHDGLGETTAPFNRAIAGRVGQSRAGLRAKPGAPTYHQSSRLFSTVHTIRALVSPARSVDQLVRGLSRRHDLDIRAPD